jgi:hypothetical protein
VSSIQWLQGWYATQCNGDWEHRYGITIQTLDNPGWLVQVDLTGTSLEQLPLTEYTTSDVHDGVERNPNWIHCSIKESRFIGAGGLGSLPVICDVFRKWAERNTR